LEVAALAVLEASPNPVVAVDRRGLVVYANPRVETTFGWRPEELIDQPVERLVPERMAGRHRGQREGFLSRPAARPMGIGLDLVVRCRDGHEFPVEISLAPIETAEGPVVVATVIDITARKRLESELLQAQKMESLGRLVGGIAHDFNNTLSAIGGNAELLVADLDSGQPPAELRRSATEIQSATARAATLTRQLLAFSRQQVVRPQIVELNAAVTEVEPMLRRLIGENVRLVLSLAPATCRLRTDSGQLDQILVNLVVNARDAITETGTITIETAHVAFDEPFASRHFELTPGAYVMLAVSDDGVGMDAPTREHAFEPFFTTKPPGKGTGLGLATVYAIVHQVGGHVWLDSEPGHGTSMKLYFPAVADQDAEPPAPRAPAAGGGSARLLLVEDEATVRDLTTRILQRAGYRVTAVDDGLAARAALEAPGATFEAVVSDVVMPGLSGTALAAWLFEHRPGVGVVLLSGYTAETLDLADTLARGARFVAKPFSFEELLTAVAAALAAASGPESDAGR
jgi:PAS domain S-box-containing protein